MVAPIEADYAGRTPDDAAVAAQLRALGAVTEAQAPWLRLDAALLAPEPMETIAVVPTLVLGIGGSALGARAILSVAARECAAPVRILDSLDDEVVSDHFEWAVGHGAQLITISKSGGSVEVVTLVEEARRRGLGPGILVTDRRPVGGAAPTRLRELLHDASLVLEIPPEVGGRYSVFTAVGQAPMRAAGLDPTRLLAGASAARARLASNDVLARRIAWRIGNPAPCSILWCYADSLLHWAAWVQQLECESLGRKRADDVRTGELVTVLRGPADQHSVAQLLLDGPRHARVNMVDFAEPRGPIPAFARLRSIERDATFEAMTLPACRLLVRDRTLETLGALFVEGMAETVVVASSWAVSPYGQPAVEQIKIRIKGKLARR